jgi:hypothetical protein
MDRPIGNDNKIHRSLEGVPKGIYIEYTTELPYFLYGEKKKEGTWLTNIGKTTMIVNQGKSLVVKTRYALILPSKPVLKTNLFF